MIEALIPWAGALTALALVCKTTLECIKLYYNNQEKIRLERLDRQLQLGARVAEIDQESVLGKIVNLAETKYYPYQIGEGVLDELKQKNLISPERARYVMIGHENHRFGR